MTASQTATKMMYTVLREHLPKNLVNAILKDLSEKVVGSRSVMNTIEALRRLNEDEIGTVVGFTGTRNGMTDNQERKLRHLLKTTSVKEAHHGDCVGADEGFHSVCTDLNIRTVIHPPTLHKSRAFCAADVIRDPKPFLARNRNIVDECDMLVAAPKGKEERRSGTWATIRYARKRHKPIFILTP